MCRSESQFTGGLETKNMAAVINCSAVSLGVIVRWLATNSVSATGMDAQQQLPGATTTAAFHVRTERSTCAHAYLSRIHI